MSACNEGNYISFSNLQVQDTIPFSIGFLLDEIPIGTGSNGILFPKGQPIPSIKVLTFQRSHSFNMEAFYADSSELPPGVYSKISCFTVIPNIHLDTLLIIQSCKFLMVLAK